MDRKRVEKEKRRDLRVGVSKPFVLKFQIQKSKGIFKLPSKKFAISDNISVGGMSIELPALDQSQIDKIAKGQDKLVLELDIPSLKKPLRIIGKIVWLEKKDRRGQTVYRTGISFEGIKEKDREEILRSLISLCLKGS